MSPCKPQRLGFPDICSKPGSDKISNFTEPILGSKVCQKPGKVSGNQDFALLTENDSPGQIDGAAADPALVPAFSLVSRST